MTMAGMNGAASSETEVPERGARRPFMQVSRLDDLVGAHPSALREYYRAGALADVAQLGDAPRGLLLAIEPTRNIHFLVRPLVNGLKTMMPWRGKTFGADGSGANLVLGRKTGRFTFATGPSDVDGQPTLILRYDDALLRNPWPLRNVRDELRMVGDGVAIGPVLFAASSSGERRVIVWFGLERQG